MRARSISSVVAALALVAAAAVAMPVVALADPAAPELTAPADGASVAANPVLAWTPVPGAVRYRVQVATSTAFASPAYDQETVATTATPPTDLPDGDLYWRVSAEDANQHAGAFSAYGTFSKDLTAPPSPVTPQDGATLSFPDDPPVFSWTPVPGAQSYTLEVDDADDFIGAASYQTANTSYTLASPQTPGQTFYWRVSATSSGGVNTSVPSAANSYTVAWDSTPTLISPPDSLSPPVADVVLAWDPVPGAATYHLQVSPNGDWANNLAVDATKLKSTRYSPPSTLGNGAYFWRVQATDAAGDNGAWSDSAPGGPAQFTRGWVHASAQSEHVTLLAPAWAPGDAIPHVDGSLGLRWSPVHHASHYEIEISSDINFSPGQSTVCFTNHTEFEPFADDVRSVVPGLCMISSLSTGIPYYWHVRPVDDPAGVLGVWSNSGTDDTFRFIVDPSRPQEVAPADGATVTVPTLSWQPVTGAEKYQVSIFRKDGLKVIGSPFTTYGTSYTPTGSLDVDDSPYRWYVQAVDGNGDTSAAPATNAQRTFLLDPLNGTGSTPTLTGPADGSSSVRMPALSWTPVTGADTYVVHVAANGFELDPLGSALHYPAYTSVARPLPPDTYTWWVEARNDDVGTLSYSGSATFTISKPGVLGSADYLAPAKCAQPGTCTPVADTPTLHWNPVPDAGYYFVSIATDPNFTNVLRVEGTAYTTMTLRESLVDNQAGQAYYWFVRPCLDSDGLVCGPAAQDDTANDNASAFQKESNPIALTSPAADATVPQQVTFTWDDFLDTNGSAALTASQEARQYQVQVSTTADFASILDSATVDQTTYTASARTYPEGPVYWRVQAIDESKNHLTWSPARRLLKQSPAVQASSPAPSATVSGVPTLQWQPSDYAATYSVEVYKNGDTSFSTANRVLSATGLKFSAYTPTTGLASGEYAWRVRAVDAGNQVRPWSSARTFTLHADAPALIGPPDQAALGAGPVFSWDPVPGAVRYTVQVSTSASFASTRANQTTVMTSWAPTAALPDGLLFWRVEVLDAGGRVLATSAVRSFAHDESAPKVTSHQPTTNLGLKGPVTVAFSEPVEHVSGATFRVTRVGSTATVAGRVTSTATGAKFVPTRPLVAGEDYRIELTSAITDTTGNALTPYSWDVRAALTVESDSPALGEHWERGASPHASGGRYDASATSGDRATFTFHGTSAKLIGTRAPDGGYASVYLDGVRKVAQLSFHRAAAQWQHVMWSVHGLSDAVHILQVRPSGTHAAGSHGSWVYVDALQVGSTLYQENSSALVEGLHRVSDPSASGGSYDRAGFATRGDDRSAPSFTVRFRGTTVDVRAFAYPHGGRARVYLDGDLVQTVDTFSSAPLHNHTVYTSPALLDREHTLSIRPVGTPTGADSTVALDSVQVH